MYLIEVNKFEAFKKLLGYKFKANMSLFYYFIVVQLIALLLTNGSSSMTSMGGDSYRLTVRGASGEMMIGFSMLWVVTISIMITTKNLKNIDFTVMTNRVLSSVTNISFILIACIFGGITASLSDVVIRILMYITKGGHNIVLENFSLTPQEILVGMIANIGYLVLLSSLGYFVGSLVQFHKSFLVIIPIIVFLGFRIDISGGPFIMEASKFITNEKLIGVFFIKIVLTSGILFFISSLVARGLEVRR